MLRLGGRFHPMCVREAKENKLGAVLAFALSKESHWSSKFIITGLKESFAFSIDKSLDGQCCPEEFV